MGPYRRSAGLLVAVLLAACQNPEDRAAKQRVFSPPPPDPVLERAKEAVDLSKLPVDDAYRLRVLGMLFPEVRARAGAGLFEVKEVLDVVRAGGNIHMEETGRIRFNARGEMDVELRTGPVEAMQLIFANEVLYLRNRSGSWRASRDPADERHYWSDQTYAALRTTTEMFNPVMELKQKGPETVDGRKGVAFDVSFKGAPKDPGVLGDPEDGGVGARLPDGGALFRAAQDRRRAYKGAEPQALKGVLVLDEQTGVPLKVDLTAVMKLPGRKTTDVSTMTIVLQSTITQVGKQVAIEPPGQAVEEISRKRVPLNPLDFADAGTTPGKPVAAPAAGGKGKPKPAEATPPPEEDEE